MQKDNDTMVHMYLVYLSALHGRLELMKYWWKREFDPNRKISYGPTASTPLYLLTAPFKGLETASRHDAISNFKQETRNDEQRRDFCVPVKPYI